MKSRNAVGTAVLSATCFAFLSASNVASAQSTGDLVGTWQFVSAVNTAKDGTKSDVFGPNPKGMMIFGLDGHFVQVLTRPGLPKFAADNRLQGTPEENKAIVQGSIALYGTYAMADKTLVLHVESGTWPSWTDTDQKRPLTSYTGNELVWTLQASVGGTNVTTFRRLK
jgi:hypothetical protein